MLTLSNLAPNPGAKKSRKRVGRGTGSGHGKTSCRGHKGQKSRSGGSIRPGFEGGQMPLQRRLPKGGFTNIFRKEFAIINIQDLERFEEGTTVDKNVLLEAGLVKKKKVPVKLLGKGELNKKLTIAVDKVSKSALEKIKAAGGTIEE